MNLDVSRFNEEVPVETDTLAARTVSAEVGNAALWMIPSQVRDVVSFRGSFETAPNLTTNDDLAQHLAVDLLDKGTLHRDRFAIAEALEGRGAQLSFYPDTLRVGFAGKVLKEDLPDVLAILAEQLREPLLDPDEFVKEKAKAIAGVRNAMDSTGAQASGALKRMLFNPDQPNHVRSFEDELAALEALALEEIQAYHAEHFGSDALRIVFAGDIDVDAVEQSVRAQVGDWSAHGHGAKYSSEVELVQPTRSNVAMAEKQNLDVWFGHALAMRRDHDDFVPLYVGNNVLGGNFSARLMQIVRDDMGLTYGIGSALAGVNKEHAGYWRIEVSLSSENLERGIEATHGVVRDFVSGGISSDELEEKKTTLAGNHVVGLATTGGLAARLLVNAERGFDVSYLDEYPDLVKALTLDQVNEAIQTHFDPDALCIAVAGTFTEAGA